MFTIETISTVRKIAKKTATTIPTGHMRRAGRSRAVEPLSSSRNVKRIWLGNERAITASLVGYLDLQERPVLLAAENVPVAGAAVGARAIQRELDRVGRGELDEVGDARERDAEQLRDAVF